jgi:ubiquinone/menaquinone biosynthesis C-methylase UbiE
MTRQTHWDQVYASKSEAELSWTQAEPATSLELIGQVCARGGSVIDVGGGTSPLAERLLDGGYSVAVLDISSQAIERARQRIGEKAAKVRWIVADVTAEPEIGTFDLWHDRAVFHFLVNRADREKYVALLARTLRPGGHAIIATFSLEGPEKCSGLPVQRYDATALARELGTGFTLLRSVPETHVTPWGKTQAFQYSVFLRI